MRWRMKDPPNLAMRWRIAPGNLKLWDLESGSLIREFGERRRSSGVVAVAFFHDGMAAVSRAILGQGTLGTRPGRTIDLGQRTSWISGI